VARKSARANRRSPWRPPALADLSARQLNALSYVVVEERVDDLIGLLVCAWPRGGAGGPPFFPKGDDELEVAVDRERLQRRLSRRRLPSSAESAGNAQTWRALQEREVVVGDVFAARLAAGSDPQELVDRIGVESWIEEIFDVSADGREAARAATYLALTPPLTKTAARKLRRKAAEKER
jgi:hypothetical protein